MNKDYGRFWLKYLCFTALMFGVGVFYIYLTVSSLNSGNGISSFVFFFPSIIFFYISYYNYINFCGVLDWLDICEDKDCSINNNVNYFFYKDENVNDMHLNIIVFNIFISIKANKIINYVIQDILFSESYTYIHNGEAYSVILSKCSDQKNNESENEDYE